MIGIVAAIGAIAVVIAVCAYYLLRRSDANDAHDVANDAAPDPVTLANLAREREYWVEVVRATIGTTDLCKGRPDPVSVAYRLGRAGAADVPDAGKAHQYALPIALAVAVGREEVSENATDDEPRDGDDPMIVEDLTDVMNERGPVTFFRAVLFPEDEQVERSVAVARLPKAIADNMARRLLLFAINRRRAMTWDAHDCSDLWGGDLAEKFAVNTGYPAGAKKVLSPRMVEHLITTRADGWMMAGEWLFVHREEAWDAQDFQPVCDEMVRFLDLLPPAPRPSNEPLAFRAPLDQWERELVTLIEVREGIFDRRVNSERRVGPAERRAQSDRREGREPPEVAAG